MKTNRRTNAKLFVCAVAMLLLTGCSVTIGDTSYVYLHGHIYVLHEKPARTN